MLSSPACAPRRVLSLLPISVRKRRRPATAVDGLPPRRTAAVRAGEETSLRDVHFSERRPGGTAAIAAATVEPPRHRRKRSMWCVVRAKSFLRRKTKKKQKKRNAAKAQLAVQSPETLTERFTLALSKAPRTSNTKERKRERERHPWTGCCALVDGEPSDAEAAEVRRGAYPQLRVLRLRCLRGGNQEW